MIYSIFCTLNGKSIDPISEDYADDAAAIEKARFYLRRSATDTARVHRGRPLYPLGEMIAELKAGDRATVQATQHSPTPWQDNDAGLIHGQVSGDDDEAPFVCDVCDNQPDYTEREKANAAFIVRACNAHSDLIETLEYIAGHASMARHHANQTGWLASLRNVEKAARDAIAKATA